MVQINPPAPAPLEWVENHLTIYRFQYESEEGHIIASVEYDPYEGRWTWDACLTLIGMMDSGRCSDPEDGKRKVEAWIAKNK